MVNSLISILVPTRGRPESVFRLIKSINETASRKDMVEIIFYVDNDDEMTDDDDDDDDDFLMMMLMMIY